MEETGETLISNCPCGSSPSPVPSVQNKLPSKGKLPQQYRVKRIWSADEKIHLAGCFDPVILSARFPPSSVNQCGYHLQISLGRTRQPGFSSYSGVSWVHSFFIFLSIRLQVSCSPGIISECFTTELAVSNSVPVTSTYSIAILDEWIILAHWLLLTVGRFQACPVTSPKLNYMLPLSPCVLVFWVFHNKIPQVGWLKQQIFIFPQFWSLEAWDQEDSKVGITWGLSMICSWPCPHMVCLGLHVFCGLFSSYKNTSHTGLEVPPSPCIWPTLS